MKRSLILLSFVLLLSSCSIYRQRVASNSTLLTTEDIDERYRPQGTVVEVYHDCSVPGPTKRRMLVYLPEGYYADDTRYPVFYLIHGARGNESSWITKGNTLHLIDSLYDTGTARKCIVVFPNLNSYKDDADYGNSRAKGAMESFFGTDGTAESAFVRDVIPVVDSLFRTIPDRKHRAIGGMSLGALQSIYISAWEPEMFDYIGMFSPMYKAPPRHGPNAWFYGHLKENQKIQFEDNPEVYDIEIGKTDFFYPHIANYRKYLSSNGYTYQYFEYPGGHEWYNWTKSVCNFMQMIFRD
ncbi:MAG: hypothetical protein MJY50_00540 [Bacteroidales bacterium]|nr:hypothetical protein [Bacteroidales bacterium]